MATATGPVTLAATSATYSTTQLLSSHLDGLTSVNPELHDAIAGGQEVGRELRDAEVASRETNLHLGKVDARPSDVDRPIDTLSDRVVDDAVMDMDAAALTESIEDRADYRALLFDIKAPDPPEHGNNFLRMFREKSRDQIGHLLSEIRDAPERVTDRIDPGNASLGGPRFDADGAIPSPASGGILRPGSAPTRFLFSCWQKGTS